MASQYRLGMRYRFAQGAMTYEGTFDGIDTAQDGTEYCRWANVLLLTRHADTPVSRSRHVPKADSHNSTVPD